MTSMPPPPSGDQQGQPANQGGYQAAPQFQPGGAPPVPASRPRSISFAKYAMWAGAVVTLLSLIPLFVMQGDMREIAEESLAATGQAVDPEIVDLVVTATVIAGVVQTALGVILWLLVALLVGKGKGWARIVGTVLFAIYAVIVLFSFTQPTVGLSLVISILTLVIGAVATFFLWQKDSTAWFQAHKAPRY